MRTWSRLPVLAAASATLLIPSLAVSAPLARASVSADGATHRSAPAAHRAPSAPARPGTGKQAELVAAALKQAKSSGKPVSVGSSSSVNPDGTFTAALAAAPARAVNGGYQVKIPSALDGATVKSAAVTAEVACSGPAKLTLSVIGAGGQSLGGGSAWKSSRSVSCGSSAVSLPVTGAAKQAAGNDWRTFTFRLSGAKASQPSLAVTYTKPAATPTGLAVSSGTLKDAACGGTSAPAVSPGTPATMQAGVYDADGAPQAARFTYWVKGTAKKTTVTSAVADSGQTARAVIPAGFTKGLARNSVVDWTAAPAGSSLSASSAACAMAVDAAAEQGAPTISGGPASDPAPGTQETYTVTAAAATQSGVTPTAVVWGLDDPPPVSDPPASQTVSIASGDTSAQVQAIVPSPGPHAFYAYVQYSDGSVSGTATSQFTADNDSQVDCPSFADALSNTLCTTGSLTGPIATTTHANQMISNGSGDTSGTADADGFGRSFPASQLQAAGWNSGGTVTVDGATFTLPKFGSSDDGNDNLLAAGQQIGLTGQGSSMVFLVAGTDGDTTAPAASQTPTPMSPVPPAGTTVTGQDCDRYQTGQSGSNCQPAPSGTITYGTDLTNPAGTENYDLEAPSWQQMTPSIATVTLPQHSDSTGLVSGSPALYAVSVPLDPTQTVVGVTLPDVGAVVKAATNVGWPAMHILGVAISNTTTATPGNLPATTANAAGPWTGSWASPPESPQAPKTGSSYNNQTIRIVTQMGSAGTTVTGTSGSKDVAVRLRLSDALADTGTGPLSIGSVTVAPQSSGAAVNTSPLPNTTPAQATFNGSKSVTIPAGTDVYSDPVLLPQGVLNSGTNLTVSIDLTGSYPSLPTATYCSACTEYVSAAGSGDQTANTDGTPFSGTGTATGDFSSILTGVDALDVDPNSTATQPLSKPTVAVLGNGVIDGNVNGSAPVHGANRVSDDLASSLAQQPGGPAYGVVNAGIEAGHAIGDSDNGVGYYGGPGALSRLARDVLAEPGIGTVVIEVGEQDLINGSTEQDLYTNGLMELSRELSAWGITTIWTTQAPCTGYFKCSSAVDNARQTVNTDLLAQGMRPGEDCVSNALPPCQYTADFATQVGQYDATGFPDELTAAADAGDHVNLSNAGYAAETRTIPVTPGTTPLSAAAPPQY
ncbi:MAG: hypothetical protein FWE35_20670 [Streptosporangiales bacterium]|nr:hypothetical protein [Streptosporangiales bacterium]